LFNIGDRVVFTPIGFRRYGSALRQLGHNVGWVVGVPDQEDIEENGWGWYSVEWLCPISGDVVRNAYEESDLQYSCQNDDNITMADLI